MSRRAMKHNASAREFSTGDHVPSKGQGFDRWTFEIPEGAKKATFVEVQAVNLSNAAGCGSYRMYLKRPDGVVSEKTEGWQPALVEKWMRGKWKLFLKTVTPCKKFGVRVVVRY